MGGVACPPHGLPLGDLPTGLLDHATSSLPNLPPTATSQPPTSQPSTSQPPLQEYNPLLHCPHVGPSGGDACSGQASDYVGWVTPRITTQHQPLYPAPHPLSPSPPHPLACGLWWAWDCGVVQCSSHASDCVGVAQSFAPPCLSASVASSVCRCILHSPLLCCIPPGSANYKHLQCSQTSASSALGAPLSASYPFTRAPVRLG